MKKILTVVLALITIFSLCAYSTPDETPSHFDTSILETWCGGPSGRVRMVGAWKYDEHGFEDETGNIWDYDGTIDEEAFYLLWLDDMGTDSVEDDQIVKVWREVC